MKVLNWVHRRFLNVHSCTTFPQDNEHDVDAKVDMFDRWNDGILAIGTLAIDPLAIGTPLPMTEEVDDGLQQEVITHVLDHIVKDNHDDDHDDHDDEASPLMNVEYFSHELEKAIGENHEITEEVEINVVPENIISIIDEGKIKKRVTLADLFLEDRDYYHPVKILKEIIDDNCVDKDGIDVTNEDKQGLEKVIMKPTSRAKYGLCKAKRLLKEDLHPIKKFNQLMKKMQKKKIHPDLEKKMNQEMHMQPSCGLNKPTNHQNTVNNELASLLLIQDATV